MQGSTRPNARRAGLGASRRSARRAARVPAGQRKKRRTLVREYEASVRQLGIPAPHIFPQSGFLVTFRNLSQCFDKLPLGSTSLQRQLRAPISDFDPVRRCAPKRPPIARTVDRSLGRHACLGGVSVASLHCCRWPKRQMRCCDLSFRQIHGQSFGHGTPRIHWQMERKYAWRETSCAISFSRSVPIAWRPRSVRSRSNRRDIRFREGCAKDHWTKRVGRRLEKELVCLGV